jgi:predicted metal-binding protein
MDEIVGRALEFGFSHAGTLEVSTLEVRSEVRDMCGADKCGFYGKNWMCPPACGGLEGNAKIIENYRAGVIVQTTGKLEDDFDYEAMLEADLKQRRLFAAFRDELAAIYPNLLALGNGSCKLCEPCPYPEPCRHPDRAFSSMEAFGLVVSDVCLKNGVKYYYGPKTLTYTGCYLLI